ncbi:L-seryl-tRNA(Sec) selenium transferase [Evansella sp. AB-rgal1]|uniref:L-seryl-tRNA(Sec) selenium transferase n=1 Tax=Evansella sp. AB-rgal1 TaxID=3242696 RepID=UPI00359E2416
MNPIRNIPAVHEIQQTAVYQRLVTNNIPEIILKDWITDILSDLRKNILENKQGFTNLSREAISTKIQEQLRIKGNTYAPYKLQRVINGTGTILHTNLGRARLSDQAITRVVETSKYYSTLEYDVELGKRGSRHDIIETLLAKASSSESAMVVNNNAAAVYLVLKALAKNKDVIVSRGELVEIGGSFRVSTIMEESGAILKEVGTTNKTHPFDYEEAISEETSMLMKVHTSNFKTVGFTKEVSVLELKQIADEYNSKNESNIIIYEDLGSGSLYPFKHDGIGDEPVVKESLKHGADVISFSGDKLLGGPQAGIIAGKKEIITKLKKHPLARVLRVDKMTLAALEATLQQYVYKDGIQDIPTIRDILQSKEEISKKVNVFLGQYKAPDNVSLEPCETTSQVGGGTMPLVEQPTVGIKMKHQKMSPTELEKALRESSTPVISRILDGNVFIDFRAISMDEITLLLDTIHEL